MTGETIRIVGTVLLTFVIGYAGYLALKKSNIPAAALTGSMLLNSAITMTGVKWAEYPSILIVLIQINIGIVIGSYLSAERVKEMKKLALPGIFLSVWMILLGIITGQLIVELTGIDVGTAYFSAAPAGASEMCALAITYDLNVPVVAMFHFLRILVVYMTAPAMAKFYINKAKKEAALNPAMAGESGGAMKESEGLSEKKEYPLALTLAIGFATGLLAWKLDVPNGPILGPMIAIGGLRICNINVKVLPKKFLPIPMVALGASLGLRITPEVARALLGLVGVAALFSLITFLSGYILAVILHKWFKIDMPSALLGCASAGVTQMSAIAMDMNADVLTVSILHSIRLIIIVLILPPYIMYVAV